MYFTILQKPHVREKCGFLKCTQPIELQYLMVINISERNQSISQNFGLKIIITGIQYLRLPLMFGWSWLCLFCNEIADFFFHGYLERIRLYLSFCHVLVIKGRNHLRLPLLEGYDKLCLLSNQISVFFDHQYLWIESSDILVFCMKLVIKEKLNLIRQLLIGCGNLGHLSNQIAAFFDQQQYHQKESIGIFDFSHGDNHQGKMSSEATAFGRVWPLLYLIQSDCTILCPSISLVRVSDDFFYGDSHQGKEHARLPLLVGCDQFCVLSIQIAGLLDHQYLCKN